MANSYINIYMNNPTAGSTDGTPVSTERSYTAPLIFTLNASQNESQVQKCAIRTEPYFVTSGTTTIADCDDVDDRLSFSWSQYGPFTDSISTDDVITETNKIFYVRASSDNSESPKNDTSIFIRVTCFIASV